MQYRLTANLGTVDARVLNEKFSSALDLKDPEVLKAGATVELTDEAAEYLRGKYPELLESTAEMKGVAKPSEITAPAAPTAHSSAEKATKDLEAYRAKAKRETE